MELFATDLDRLGFLLETDAALGLPAGMTAFAVAGAICEECSHFSAAGSRCQVHNADRAFDASACRFLDRREAG